MMLSLLPLLASAPLTSASPAQDPIVLVTTQLETQLARETLTVRGDGWDSVVEMTVPGRTVDFTCSMTRSAERTTWKVVIPEATMEATLEGSRVTGSLNSPDGLQSKSIDFETEGEVQFFFENLVFGCFHELSRQLLTRGAAGELEAGQQVMAIMIANEQAMPFTLTSFERSEEGIWTFTISFPPGLDMTWTCGEDGLPITIDVPAQRLTVRREGARIDPDAGARSPVDRGTWRAKLSQPTSEFTMEEDVKVPMGDGVELAADVYRPEGEGPFPTILVRTPYDRANEGLANGARFAKRGYAVVVQDVRGRFDSGGTFFPFIHEERDGSDTIDWIADQPWSDGGVGMIGGSYTGMVQWYAAKSGNPHLKAIIPQVSPPDPDQNFPYEGGVLLMGAAWWAGVLAHMDAGGVGIPDKDYAKVMATLPLGDLDQAFGSSEPFLDEWLSHPPVDEEYWGPVRYQPHLPEMEVAALHLTGWFDGDQPGALQNFPAMREHGKSRRVRKGQSLIVGPWGHGFNVMSKLGDVDFGPESLVDLASVEVRFFDRYLKRKNNGVEREKPVWVFVMGENAWHNEEAWPLPGTVTTPLYLSSNGNAQSRDGGGRAGLAPGAGSEAGSTVIFDPADIPDLDLDWTDTTGQQATRDLNSTPDRADELEFLSPPLAGPVELTGPFEAELHVRSSAADADFMVSIQKIGVDGRALGITGGIQRMRYRNGVDDPVPAGEVARLVVDCWASGIRLEKGERIRVVVGCSGFPGYARNPGTLEPQLTTEALVTAQNELLHSAEHPSHIRLPVVPREDAPGLSFED